MTRPERIKNLQEKTTELVNWFEGKELPKSFKLSPGENVGDAVKFRDSQLRIFAAYKANPFSTAYVTAYKRLDHLKNYIEYGNKKQKMEGAKDKKG